MYFRSRTCDDVHPTFTWQSRLSLVAFKLRVPRITLINFGPAVSNAEII